MTSDMVYVDKAVDVSSPPWDMQFFVWFGLLHLKLLKAVMELSFIKSTTKSMKSQNSGKSLLQLQGYHKAITDLLPLSPSSTNFSGS